MTAENSTAARLHIEDKQTSLIVGPGWSKFALVQRGDIVKVLEDWEVQQKI